MLKKIKQFIRGQEPFNVEDSLSPSCLRLLKTCCGFEEDTSIVSIGIYPEKGIIVAAFVCPYEKRVEVTFSGVADAAVICKGEALARDEMIDLLYEHDVDEFEVRGTCYYRDRGNLFHTHVVRMMAEDLIVMFTFGDLTFRQGDCAARGAT